MSANLSKLKGKGAPPRAEDVPEITGQAPRGKGEPTKPLQFRVPESVFEAFSQQAGKEFGYAKGSKVGLFLKMWNAYHSNIS